MDNLLVGAIIILKQFDIGMPLLNMNRLVGSIFAGLGLELPFTLPVGQVLGTVLLLAVIYWLYRVARGERQSA